MFVIETLAGAWRSELVWSHGMEFILLFCMEKAWRETRKWRGFYKLSFFSLFFTYHIWNSLKHWTPLYHYCTPLFQKLKKKDEKKILFPQNPLPPPPISGWSNWEGMVIWKPVKTSSHMLISIVSMSICVCCLGYYAKSDQLFSVEASPQLFVLFTPHWNKCFIS